MADTSWLYAIFHEGDAHADEAHRLVLEPRPMLVPAAIMVETLDLMRLRLGKDAAMKTEAAMERFPHFDTGYPVSQRAALAVGEQHPRLSLTDAHAVALGRSTGFRLVTFDRNQAAVQP